MAPLRIGIGIHTGEVFFAGNVEGAGKVKDAVVGNTVNRARGAAESPRSWLTERVF
ncbi:MAG: hypothetical protein DMD97_01565 [Candidatus Rokuibacteriota bacterium]|nr:MAG: hypothetical protein DMD97_01565 [Candidatus Rokubacteria bacterium]